MRHILGLVATLALAFSATQASLPAHGGTGTGSGVEATVAASVQALQPDAVEGAQGFTCRLQFLLAILGGPGASMPFSLCVAAWWIIALS